MTRIQPYIICTPDKGKEIITKFVSRESSENDVVEVTQDAEASESRVGCCSLLKDCSSSNILSCHCSEGINTRAIIKLNHFPEN